MSDKQWYALRTKSHKEKGVESLLLEKNLEAFLPILKVKPANPRSRKWKTLFPGYIFVYSTPQELAEKQIQWVRGSIGLVMYGEIPAVVPDSFIKQLTDRLSQIVDVGGYSKEFLKGDKVRIISGPLKGYEAVFDFDMDSKDRVIVLLSLINEHTQKVQIDASLIEKM